jgi:hypothetical protein
LVQVIDRGGVYFIFDSNSKEEITIKERLGGLVKTRQEG